MANINDQGAKIRENKFVASSKEPIYHADELYVLFLPRLNLRRARGYRTDCGWLSFMSSKKIMAHRLRFRQPVWISGGYCGQQWYLFSESAVGCYFIELCGQRKILIFYKILLVL